MFKFLFTAVHLGMKGLRINCMLNEILALMTQCCTRWATKSHSETFKNCRNFIVSVFTLVSVKVSDATNVFLVECKTVSLRDTKQASIGWKNPTTLVVVFTWTGKNPSPMDRIPSTYWARSTSKSWKSWSHWNHRYPWLSLKHSPDLLNSISMIPAKQRAASLTGASYFVHKILWWNRWWTFLWSVVLMACIKWFCKIMKHLKIF